jgi:hypothetical protein
MRRWMPAAGVAAALAAMMPAAAQQAPASSSTLPHPTDSGKPLIYDPQSVANAGADVQLGCTPGLQCRLRLLGVIQNNGVVELRATALRW